MKTSNVNQGRAHPEAIIRGWVSSKRAGSTGITVDGSSDIIGILAGTGVTVVDNGDGTVTISAGGGSLPWFNVMDYGATGDGTTDDTAAVSDATNARDAAGGGVLYFPATADSYEISSALPTIITPGLVLGDGGSVYGPATRINQSSASANLFTVDTDGLSFRGMYLGNTSGGATTSDGIAVTDGKFAEYKDLTVVGFRDGISLTGNEAYWRVAGPMYLEATRYDIHVVNTSNPDAGDWMIGPGVVLAGAGGSNVVGVYLENSGGGRIIGNKINMADNSGTIGIQVEYDEAVTTQILLIEGNTIENVRSEAIKVTTSGASCHFNDVVVTGNQFGLYSLSLKPAITLSASHAGNISRCIITGNSFHSNSDSGNPVIAFNNVDGVRLGENYWDTFSAYYTTSGTCTNIVDEAAQAPSTVNYLVGTASAGLSAEIVVGTSPGGELGGTWASPTVDSTHAGSAHIALSTATPLVESGAGSAGSGTTASKSDHVHPAASGGGIGELVISDTPSTPLVFADLLQNEAQDDFLYADP